MAEWLKAHAWRACIGFTLSWVRIPLSPPNSFLATKKDLFLTNLKKYKLKNIISLKLLIIKVNLMHVRT